MRLCSVIARSVGDEAIQTGAADWIASLHYVPLAMTDRSRDAAAHPSYATPRSRHSLTRHHRLDPVVHAELQQANAGGSIRKRDFRMDCRIKSGNDEGKNEEITKK